MRLRLESVLIAVACFADATGFLALRPDDAGFARIG